MLTRSMLDSMAERLNNCHTGLIECEGLACTAELNSLVLDLRKTIVRMENTQRHLREVWQVHVQATEGEKPND